jgi:hypothetical protein
LIAVAALSASRTAVGAGVGLLIAVSALKWL